MTNLPFPDEAALRVQAEDTIPEAARKILLFDFQQLLQYAESMQDDTDPNLVHQMRIKTRRMRAVYRIFGAYLPPTYHRKVPKVLRRTARLLGEVRDLDVFIARTEGYIQAELDGDSVPLASLIKLNQTEHHVASSLLVNWLNSRKYEQFESRFYTLLMKPTDLEHLQDPDAALHFNYRVVHHIHALVWHQYGILRRYEDFLPTSDVRLLHRVRIESKRLRYTLNAVQPIFDDPIQSVQTELKALQEYLGEVNDLVIAIEQLGVAYDCVPISKREAVVIYQDFCKAQLDQAIAGFMPHWENFMRYEVRVWLGKALARP